MSDQSFQDCYRHLIGSYQLTPERASNQLAVILNSCLDRRRGRPPDEPADTPRTNTDFKEGRWYV